MTRVEDDVTTGTDSKTKAAKPVAKVATVAVAPKPKAAAKPAAPKLAKPAPVPPSAPVIAETPVAEQPAAAAVETLETVVVTATEIAAAEAPAILKETIMNATIKDAADKGQAYFAEFTAKAKEATEKSTKAVEEFNDFAKGNVEAVVESGKIAAKGLETLGQGYAEYSRKSFEGATAVLKNLAGVKTPAEFMQLHTDFIRGQFDSIVAETSKNTEAFIKLAGDVAQPISNRVAVAAEKIKVAA
jgi:phasin family protein